jgi:hypothetical protein
MASHEGRDILLTTRGYNVKDSVTVFCFCIIKERAILTGAVGSRRSGSSPHMSTLFSATLIFERSLFNEREDPTMKYTLLSSCSHWLTQRRFLSKGPVVQRYLKRVEIVLHSASLTKCILPNQPPIHRYDRLSPDHCFSGGFCLCRLHQACCLSRWREHCYQW